MQILYYNELNISQLEKKYKKVIDMLRQADFYLAEVKKLTGTPYYRAKLDHSNRLLFKVVDYRNQKYVLILEVIRNHAYEKSRFLNGAKIDEHKIESTIEKEHFENKTQELITYINPQNYRFHFLDKIISFDEEQDKIFCFSPPLIIIGSAGSGKTVLTLEKMKNFVGDILYVTNSPYLVQNSRNLYYTNGYANENQNLDFLSYRELLEILQVPQSKEVTFRDFSLWLSRINRSKNFQDANKLYEEFKGVITGSPIDKKYLIKEDYLNLGIKQSIYAISDRQAVYDLFKKYLEFLKNSNFYDINLLSYDYLPLCKAKYDFVIIDEVQDFTNIQLFLALKMLKNAHDFILCGDSNQIVHPNFFSWSSVKSLFYRQDVQNPVELIRILSKNYRNAPSVTALANKILRLKNTRFGSIDKESHYLVESRSQIAGEIYCLLETDFIKNEINKKTQKSIRFAVVVLHDNLKVEARKYFQTPLIFSIHEVKGLEYDNIILYNFVTSEAKKFQEIAADLSSDDLHNEFSYSRAKDKTNRSLEIYKFYINALYVAITRAIKNVYIIENRKQHSLIDLLSLIPTAELITIEGQESSAEEWQQEACRLELQGKQEQVDAIRDNILHTQKVPWDILTEEKLALLRERVWEVKNNNKKECLLLFECALVYNLTGIIEKLAYELGFAPAQKPKKGQEILERKYFMFYCSNNTATVMRQVTMYGVDFRNMFNQTPLMIASNFGNVVLVKQLLEHGANPYLTDNIGRNAWQIALQKALLDQSFTKHKLVALYNCLPQEGISLQSDGKLVKIDVQRMEFFLVNAMLVLSNQKCRQNSTRIFNVNSFLVPLTSFPEVVVPKWCKRRAYISSILSKHEIYRDDIYNRKLFLRVQHGYYILNPKLLIKINEEWIMVEKLLGYSTKV